jgi:hypothetical protein
MKCPTELTWSTFADGELPEAEARDAARHLESCSACGDLLAALQGESRLLVQCLQDVCYGEEAALAVHVQTQPVPVGRFVLAVLGVAAAFRLSTAILFGFELPAGFEWLDPRVWALNVGLAANTVLYAIDNTGPLVRLTLQAVLGVSLAGLAVTFGLRAIRKTPAVSAVLGVVLALALFAPSGYAIDVRRGEAANVAKDEVIDDTVIAIPGGQPGAGGDVTIEGTITGDLIAFGNVVRITGTVEGDVISGARRLEILGKVGGNVVGAGQALTVSGEIARNLAGFGSIINVSPGATLGGNGALFGGEMVLEGNVARDLFLFAGMSELRGTVGRNVAFRGGQLMVPASAQIGGGVEAYVDAEKNVHIDPKASIGGTRKITLPVARPSAYSSTRFYFWQVVRLIAAFVTGLVVFRLAPSLAPTRLVSGMDWLKAGGLGFAALVTIPIAAVIVAFTVIGLPLAITSFVIWMAALYLAKIIVAEFIGRSLLKQGGVVSLFVGLLIVIVAVNLPILGGLLNFLLCLLGMGALVMTIYLVNRRPLQTA